MKTTTAARPPYDLVVVGAGMSGLTAALRATQLGLRVLVVEKSAAIPGRSNSLVSGGILHAVGLDPGTPPQELIEALRVATGGASSEDVAQAWSRTTSDAVGWAVRNGATLERGIGRWPVALKPVKGFSPGLQTGFGADTFLTAVATRFRQAGGEVVASTRATSLVIEADRVVGIELESNDGRRTRCPAPAVLLADGGFQADPELVRRHLGSEAYKLRAVDTGTGDGLRMASTAGAALVGLDRFYGHPLHRDSLFNDALWPYPILDPLTSAGVLVSVHGEVLTAPHGVAQANALLSSRDPLGWWVVIDENAWLRAAADDGVLLSERLADARATIRTGRGLQEVLLAAGFSWQAVSTLARRLGPGLAGRAGPLVAMPLVAGVTFTMGGVRIDGRARALRGNGQPVPGLLAAGATTGGLHGGPQAGYAGGLLAALTFGFIAAGTAAGLAGALGGRDGRQTGGKR